MILKHRYAKLGYVNNRFIWVSGVRLGTDDPVMLCFFPRFRGFDECGKAITLKDAEIRWFYPPYLHKQADEVIMRDWRAYPKGTPCA